MNGLEYKNLLNAGFGFLKSNCALVNDLNVFPIPDGDTGDNMCSTLLGGLSALGNEVTDNLSEISAKASHGMLLGARGNSGVILSQIFAGINAGFVGLEDADVESTIKALKTGVSSAYSAVDKPSEGTILTVYREAVEAVENMAFNSLEELFAEIVKAADVSLENTPDKLACLKEAGVVDSGGAGLCFIFKGFLAYLRGENVENELAATEDKGVNQVDISKFTADTQMKFGYCTEFLLQLTNAKTNIAEFDIENYKNGLKELGDSLVAFINGSVVKTHIHSYKPDRIIAYALSFGEFLTIKIENMTLQHNETLFDKDTTEQENSSLYVKSERRKNMGIVAVATGDGLMETFRQLGADVVICGGQGNNPSTEDFIKAYDAVNADNIFVLPNNGNIYLVAKASADVYEKSNIHVVNTKSIGEGYSVLSTSDTSGSIEEITASMDNSVDGMVTGSVCVATRNANIDCIEINEGDYVGFSGKHILSDSADKNNTAFELLVKLGINGKDFLVAFYGNTLTAEERQGFETELAKKYPTLEFYGIDGGQDIYDYIFVL